MMIPVVSKATEVATKATGTEIPTVAAQGWNLSQEKGSSLREGTPHQSQLSI